MPQEPAAPKPSPPGSSTRHGWLHWGLLMCGLYLAVIVVITVPIISACFPKTTMGALFEVYASGQYWILAGLILLGQFLLLRVPVRLATQRPVSRSSVWLPILVSGFWLGLLVAGLGCTLMELFKISAGGWPALLLTGAVLTWGLWAAVFARMARNREPAKIVQEQSRWMLRGSILELLVAVPSHIWVRGRTDCCAGLFTFMGITMGVSVMLLSFGPGVFFLYYARRQRLTKARAASNPAH